jgi:dTDP-glucose pyrophosphorylase/predicted transcriptional regulator
MKPIADLLVRPEQTMLDAVRIIDKGGLQIALIVDDAGRLLGTATDGDVRRALLKGLPMSAPVVEVMNSRPRTAQQGAGARAAIQIMTDYSLRQVPVIDEHDKLLGIEYAGELMQHGKRDAWVVLMAGGLGTRLRPITDTTPKPLIPVGGRPLLEGIISSFADQGFERFFLSLNYKPELFKAYFGDGKKLGVSIEYLEEVEPRGTAGALSLLPEQPTRSLVVMNGDLLTSANFGQLMDFHEEHAAIGTMCVREYRNQVPYGVVETDHHRFLGVIEKPVQTYFVNAGIYALSPEALRRIPEDRSYNMTDLFTDFAASKESAAVFPIREYWLDVGRLEDLERAQLEYSEVFPR